MPYTTLSVALAAAAPVLTDGVPLTNVGETLASLRGELIVSLGGRTDIDAPRYDRWINLAYIDVCSSLDIETLFSGYSFVTTAAQPLYTLPPQVSSIKGISVVDAVRYPEFGGRPLKSSDLSEYRAAKELTEEPRSYFRIGRLLVIYPTPDTGYTLSVDFRVRPDRLVNNTDSPIIPWEFHEAILLAARQKGFSGVFEFDKALAVQNEFVGLVRRKRDEGAEADSGRIVASSVPRRMRDLYRGSTPRELDDRW